jgi:type IV secretory pathway VirD2 relaxase
MSDDTIDEWFPAPAERGAERRGQTGQKRSGAGARRILRIAGGALSPRAKQVLRRALRAAVHGGHKGTSARSPNRRGAGVKAPGKFAQRVIVKARIVPMKGKSPLDVMRNHLAYLARDGADRDGDRGKLFNGSGELDREAVDAFAERGVTCRHQFRFIVSPEHGGDIDMPQFARDLVRRMEHDLDTRLDSVAVVHYDTDQPHVHLVVNGRDDRGGDLVISRDYVSNGLRHRAMELATDELGYRTELDLFRSLERDVRANRFTALDRRLQTLAERSPDGQIDLRRTPGDPRQALQRKLYLGRLAYLQEIGLSEKVEPGTWRLAPDALDRLRGATQHRDILRSVERHVEARDRVGGVNVIDKATLDVPVEGRVLGRGHANELSGTQYLVVSATDGKTYYVALSPHAERHLEHPSRVGDLVTLRRVEPRASGRADRAILDVAVRNGSVYDASIHRSELGHRPLPHGATPERFVEAHVRRLDALASRGFVTREADGRYRVPPDLIERLTRDPAIARDGAFVQVDVRGRDLPAQAAARAYTWLDEQLVDGVPQQVKQATVRTRFQDELIDAADQRAKRLVQLGLAQLHGDRLSVDPNLKPRLERIERDAAAERLSEKHGRFVDLDDTRHFRGCVVAIENLASGPHAVVVDNGRFTLVSAERGLGNAVGKDVSLTRDRSPARNAEQARVRFRELDAMDVSPSLGR